MNAPTGQTAQPRKRKYFPEDEQGVSLFQGMDSGLDNQSEVGSLVNQNLTETLSGAAYDPARTQQRETLARAAKSLRSQSGAANTAALGQGMGTKVQGQVEQNIFQTLADTEMGMDVAEQEMKERGIGLATDIGRAQQEIATTRRGQDIGLQIEESRLAETARQFNITTAQVRDQFDKTLQFNYDELSTQDRQFLATLGLSREQFEESRRQFNEQLAVDKQLGMRGLDIQQENTDLARAGLQGFYDPYTGTWVSGSAQLATTDQQLRRDSLYGYMGQDGTWISGSIQLANDELGLKADTIELTKQELFGYTDEGGVFHPGKYDLLSAEDKRNADRLYGYTDDAGVYHMGEMEIAEKNVEIIEMSETRAADAMYGYTDPVTGERIRGSAEIASEMLGLESLRYDDQRVELYGGMIDTDGDGVVDTQVTGKYEQMTAAEKRAADELYGYTDNNGNHVSGMLELQNDATEIQRQGLSIEKAKVYGYQKEDGTWVNGTLENEAARLGIDISDYQLRRDQLYGYDEKDSLGNVIRHVNGALDNAADSLGLQSKTLDTQITELFGGRVDTNGDGIPDKDISGKYDLLSEEQKRAADELYGFNDPETGDWIMGSMQFNQDMTRISASLAEKGLNSQNIMSIIEALPPEQQADAISKLALDAGMEYQAVDSNGELLYDEETGSPVMAPGLKNYAASYGQDSNKSFQKAISGETLSGNEYNSLKSTITALAEQGKAIVDTNIETTDPVRWTTTGANRWILTDSTKQWVADNKGKVYQASNGRLYIIQGFTDPGGGAGNRGKKGAILFKDVQSGLTVRYTRGSGFPETGE